MQTMEARPGRGGVHAGATLLLCFLLAVDLTIGPALAFYVPHNEYRNTNLERNKRYTDSQDRAAAFCTGMCMYGERKAYSDCYDLCNWNGRGTSPWLKLGPRGGAGGEELSPEVDPGLANFQSLQRSGSGGGKLRMGVGSGDKARMKTKAGMKKGSWSDGGY